MRFRALILLLFIIICTLFVAFVNALLETEYGLAGIALLEVASVSAILYVARRYNRKQSSSPKP